MSFIYSLWLNPTLSCPFQLIKATCGLYLTTRGAVEQYFRNMRCSASTHTTTRMQIASIGATRYTFLKWTELSCKRSQSTTKLEEKYLINAGFKTSKIRSLKMF